MNITKNLSLGILITAAMFSVYSCESRPDVEGTWSGTPVRIDGIADAADADAPFTLVFIGNESDKKVNGGQIIITALIDANQAVSTDAEVIDEPYEVSVASTATISGKWSFEKDDNDDITIDLEDSTLQVNVDPHGVTFSSNVLTGVQQPRVDSLTVATVSIWKENITKAISSEFNKFRKISDIKIKNGIVSCEVNDRDLTFRKQ